MLWSGLLASLCCALACLSIRYTSRELKAGTALPRFYEMVRTSFYTMPENL